MSLTRFSGVSFVGVIRGLKHLDDFGIRNYSRPEATFIGGFVEVQELQRHTEHNLTGRSSRLEVFVRGPCG